jgi:hypothetical protein
MKASRKQSRSKEGEGLLIVLSTSHTVVTIRKIPTAINMKVYIVLYLFSFGIIIIT